MCDKRQSSTQHYKTDLLMTCKAQLWLRTPTTQTLLSQFKHLHLVPQLYLRSDQCTILERKLKTLALKVYRTEDKNTNKVNNYANHRNYYKNETITHPLELLVEKHPGITGALPGRGLFCLLVGLLSLHAGLEYPVLPALALGLVDD